MTCLPALATFDPAEVGSRFTLRYRPPPQVATRGTIVLAPPFAEEMNKCRRMTSLTARHLAESGWRVVVRDLRGCGDSSGDFADASWQDWIEDLAGLVKDVSPSETLWLWGVRAGALLLPSLVERRPNANLLLWQPGISGRNVLGQFLRLKAAGAALEGKERIDTKHLMASLLDGRPEEVAGYAISPSLAVGLERATLTLPDGWCGRILWLEVAAGEPATLTPASHGLRREWAARGLQLQAAAVRGEQFWQTQETTECAALVEATVRGLKGEQ